jgi:aryl-alcohol dehydrogenase-like predicted oxidoreductase
MQRKLDVIEQLLKLSAELGVSLARYAVAWTLANPVVTAPIIGPRTMDQLEDLLPAAELRLPAEHLAQIDELVPPGTNVDPRAVRYGD